MEETVQKLIEVVMNTAPELWRIARAQVNVQIVYGLFAYLFLMAMCVVSIPLYKRAVTAVRKMDSFESDFAEPLLVAAVMTTVGFFLLGTIFGFFGYIVPRLMNSDWYAIEVLLNLIK